jgi:hypothetical protein
VSGRRRSISLALLVVELGGIVWLVLNPSPATPTNAVSTISDWLLALEAPHWLASTAGWEYLLNVALFVPLGFLAALVWDRVLTEVWVIAAFAVSLLLEGAQLFLPHRSPTLLDLSSNTVGGFTGAALALLVLSVWPSEAGRPCANAPGHGGTPGEQAGSHG